MPETRTSVRRQPSTRASPRRPAAPRTTSSHANPWYEWGPYLSERAWGTVREDYSRERRRLGLVPARPRALARLPLERGRHGRASRTSATSSASRSRSGTGDDPILKERMFGLDRAAGQPRRGRQGVLVVPRGAAEPRAAALALPLPAGGVPVRAARRTTAAACDDPELELLDTGVFDDDRYWSVDVTYAKASPTEVLVRIELENHGPDEATLHVLPTLWFRNTWSLEPPAATRPRIERDGTGARRRRPRARRLPARGARPGPTARRRSRSSARTRRTPRASSARRPTHAVPEGRDQRPRRLRRRHGQPGRASARRPRCATA